MKIKLTKDEQAILRDKMNGGRDWINEHVQTWFFDHHNAYYKATFKDVCDDWGYTLEEGGNDLFFENKHFSNDLTNLLLINSGMLIMVNAKQYNVAKHFLESLEYYVENGITKDVAREIFIRECDNVIDCLEHLKNEVINSK